ncbi:uncharacterized protein LOC123316921 [Coccinella septempunctata]|uniref:uncharacterized protein LOC123316921 n=1 Tax=Coccinella septempunctata TaxID=41139 RepID=UPI001D05E672|nr:uncharacterized protein LOC123316921 [Coccinella septempunctata]
MENSLDRVMDETLSQPGVYGCVFSDDHGLGLGAKGKASVDSSGVIAAIAMVAAKLEPHNENPIISFENDSRTCIIKRNKNLIGAIFKTTGKS